MSKSFSQRKFCVVSLLKYSMTLIPELGPYKNRNRVLLIFAPSSKDAAHLEQKRLLARAENGLRERSLVVLEVFADDTLKDFFDVAEAFMVVLIGKDGGEKRRYASPAEPEVLFALIDQMPMRRREMREQREP